MILRPFAEKALPPMVRKGVGKNGMQTLEALLGARSSDALPGLHHV